MNKATVTIEVIIPDGYELAEPAARRAKLGEHYLTYGQIVTWAGDSPLTAAAHPIIRKKWEPEIGKWYHFSNKSTEVGTCTGALFKFTGMVDGRYAESRRYKWDHCWPAPEDSIELGK